MQIIKNLKPYWKSVLIIVLLLIVQAYCDLALPDYTSKLIDTGIQNYGIDHCSPLQIPEKAYTIIKGFMDEDDVTVWEKYYEQSDDGIYHMTDDGKDHIDEIDQACMEPMMMYYYPYTMVDSDEDNQLKQMLAASGMTLDELPPEMWSQMGTQMKQMIDSMRDSMGDDMMMSSAITCTRTCYDSMDYNYKDIQMSYLKRVGVEMILMTLLMVASAILTGLVAARVAAGVGCDLRESIFKRVISFSDAEINRFSTASLITRSTNDVQQIQMVTVMLLRMVLYAPVLAVGGIIKVVESGASMGWVIVVAVAGILVVLGVLMAIALPKFKIMQNHTIIGASILENMGSYQDEELMKVAYQICRWHHERYDGKGYPDGLKGDEIPISAQVVSLADVYDALVSERVYKKAYSHEKAIEMITNGECGCFNPILLECLLDIQDRIKRKMKTGTPEDNPFKKREKKAELKEFENVKEDFMDVVSKNMEKEYSNFENDELVDFSRGGQNPDSE